MWLRLFFIGLLLLSFSGCATTKKDLANPPAQELQARISELESLVQEKDKEIDNLETQLAKIEAKSQSSAADKESRTGYKKTARNIQLALKNANLYNGPVDGKIGRETKGAIKEFQKVNGLMVDGVVGEETWSKLKNYLRR